MVTLLTDRLSSGCVLNTIYLCQSRTKAASSSWCFQHIAGNTQAWASCQSLNWSGYLCLEGIKLAVQVLPQNWGDLVLPSYWHRLRICERLAAKWDQDGMIINRKKAEAAGIPWCVDLKRKLDGRQGCSRPWEVEVERRCFPKQLNKNRGVYKRKLRGVWAKSIVIHELLLLYYEPGSKCLLCIQCLQPYWKNEIFSPRYS